MAIEIRKFHNYFSYSYYSVSDTAPLSSSVKTDFKHLDLTSYFLNKTVISYSAHFNINYPINSTGI